MTPSPGPSFLTTRELAELLRIKERKVYELAASGDVPVSRATGKLLFPRGAVEAWIARSSTGPGTEETLRRPPVLAGSHDPLLDWALRESRAGLASYFDGSLDGLSRFAAGEAMAAGVHLRDPHGDGWNGAVVTERFAAQPVVLVEFAWRERGLAVSPALEAVVRGIPDLAGRSLVPRQPESGSQRLLEQLLENAGLAAETVSFAAPARTETDAVLAVAQGKGDAALGLPGLAATFGLGFVPLLQERFDLLVDRRAWFEPPMQRLLAFCRSAAFLDKALELGGYDVSELGRVHFNGA